MTDTVTRLMALADEFMIQERDGTNGYEARQALHDELTRLFTPLSDEQIRKLWYYPEGTNSVQTLFRLCENEHGITGDSKRCPLCNYQHGHQIWCKNNPVDIALQDGIGGES